MQEKTNVWIVLWVTVRMFLTLEEHTSVSGIKLWLFIHENGRRILNRTSEIQTRDAQSDQTAPHLRTHTHTFEMCGDFPYTSITFILTKKYFLSPNLTENLFASFTNFNDFLFHRGDHRPVPTMSKMSGFTILFFLLHAHTHSHTHTHTDTLTETHTHRDTHTDTQTHPH